MLAALLRAVIVVVLVVAAIAFVTGYWLAERPVRESAPSAEPRTGGSAAATGRVVGERVGAAADQAVEALSDAGITAKIKSKMALDDFVKARRIDVDTSDGVVTLTGVVRSEAERERAVRLARETAGVRSVIDRLRVGSS
ncbi:MAG TPA: BON domain-containing protein [Vicinamibacterales bacterium]|nr:BON domain-containing protein [Vicinamibacterales bacterium]